jgi:hypothetical protein
MIDIPLDYARWLEALGFDEISFGAGGLRFEPTEALAKFQVGYALTPDGMSLCTADPGAWQSTWLAIGHDTSVGDPLLLDLSESPLRVYTAMHGVGSWDPICVANSLGSFRVALHEVQQLSVGRENPVLLERNPVSASERLAALQRIVEASPGIDTVFWELQLQDYQ